MFAVDVDVLKEVVVILPLRTTLPVQSNERKSVNIRRTDTKERPLVFEAIFLFVCFFSRKSPYRKDKELQNPLTNLFEYGAQVATCHYSPAFEVNTRVWSKKRFGVRQPGQLISSYFQDFDRKTQKRRPSIRCAV